MRPGSLRRAATPLKSGSWRTVRSSGKSGRTTEDGQVTILLIGFVVVALALIAVVASAAQVHVERTRLAALADLAALTVAERVSDEAYFAPSDRTYAAAVPGATGGKLPGSDLAASRCAAGTALAASDDEIAAAVDDYLTGHPDAAARWTGLRVVDAGSPDGRTVRVTLGAVVRPAWTAWVLAPFGDGIGIGASSAARAW